MKKRYRVRSNQDFQQLFSTGKHKASRNFVVYYGLRRMLTNDRVGISVGKKLGNAVERNRIKRQVRMMVSEITDFSNGFDSVIIVRNHYKKCSYEDNKKELLKLYESVYNNNVD